VEGVFVSHGSPTVLVEDLPWRNTFRLLGRLLRERVDPEVVVVLSPHFRSPSKRHYVEVGEVLECIQDYYGFPEELYEFCYSAVNDVELAKAVIRLAKSLGVPAEEDSGWGLDHGAWIPLYFMFPEGVKAVAVSISGGDFAQHYRLGEAVGDAVAELGRRAAVVATGSSTHRLDVYLRGGAVDYAFDRALIKALEDGRFEDLLRLDSLPGFGEAQPEGELKTLAILLGAVKPRRCEVVDYAVPWPGVSMLAAYCN